MHDADVREVLLRQLRATHGADDDALIVEELGVGHGRRRVDVAVVNGELIGYEIKSAADTLSRLPGQAELYGAVFDRVGLVCADRHVTKAMAAVPSWWGVDRAVHCDGDLVLAPVRHASVNDRVDGRSVAQLLWRDEAIDLLTRQRLDTPALLRGARRHMYAALADAMPLTDLRREVRACLRQRDGWRTR